MQASTDLLSLKFGFGIQASALLQTLHKPEEWQMWNNEEQTDTVYLLQQYKQTRLQGH